MKRNEPIREKRKSISSPALPHALAETLVVIVMLVSAAASGMGFIVIAGSTVPRVLAGLCACVLVILPAFVTKTFAIFAGFRNRKALCLLSVIGFVFSLYPVLCFFVSHDYQLSVYRYMKTTTADVYYFGGIDGIKKDYDSTEDYMEQMKQAPASIVLQSMSREKLHKLSSEELKTINNESLWEYCGFDEILGTNADEVHDSMEHAAKSNAYDFTFDYRGLSPKNMRYMLKNPGVMFHEFAVFFIDGTHSASPAVMIFFFAGQLFALYMISVHFDVDEKGQLVYLYEKHERSFIGDSIAFLRSAYGKDGRKRSRKREHIRIPAPEPPDSSISPADAAKLEQQQKEKKTTAGK